MGMNPAGPGMPQGFRPPGMPMNPGMGEPSQMAAQMSAGGGQLPPPGMSQMPGGPAEFQQTRPNQGGLQGPLAYLEKTTSNIGMPDMRR